MVFPTAAIFIVLAHDLHHIFLAYGNLPRRPSSLSSKPTSPYWQHWSSSMVCWEPAISASQLPVLHLTYPPSALMACLTMPPALLPPWNKEPLLEMHGLHFHLVQADLLPRTRDPEGLEEFLLPGLVLLSRRRKRGWITSPSNRCLYSAWFLVLAVLVPVGRGGKITLWLYSWELLDT